MPQLLTQSKASSDAGQNATAIGVRIAVMLLSFAIGGAFALDTWNRGWSVPAVTASLVAAIAGCCAGIGRLTKRPKLERASPVLAYISLVIVVVAGLLRWLS